MTRLLRIGLLATVGLASLSVVACGGRAEVERVGAAAAGVVQTDIDPEITGNTANTLGTIENCVRVDGSGGFDGVTDHTIDVVVAGDTQAPVAYDAWVTYDKNVIHILDKGTDALIKMSDAMDLTVDEAPRDDDNDGYIDDGCPALGAAESGTECAFGDSKDDDLDGYTNDGCPTVGDPESGDECDKDLYKSTDGQLDSGSIYFAGGPGTAGDGTLLRIALDINFNAGPTLVSFGFTKSVYKSGLGDHLGGTVGTAFLAINQDCPALPPTSSPTPTPTLAPGTPTPLPTPPPGTILLMSGWNNPCYVGPEQPIEDALAGMGDQVVAVYRMRADQGFDRWFPDRPEASTITAVSSYQPLLILMGQYGFWPHEPSGTSPSFVSLASGWNNVCYTGQTKSVGDATAGVAGGFVIMYRLGSEQGWSRYVPGRPEVSNIDQLNQYDTVLMLVSQEAGTIWTFDP